MGGGCGGGGGGARARLSSCVTTLQRSAIAGKLVAKPAEELCERAQVPVRGPGARLVVKATAESAAIFTRRLTGPRKRTHRLLPPFASIFWPESGIVSTLRVSLPACEEPKVQTC